jgi:cation diffusion facilitator CzcD-associated flavoprotein CzcO
VLYKIEDGTGGLVNAESDYDFLVCATRFQSMAFMHPINEYGKKSRSIRDVWNTGAKADHGVCVEEMPNFALLCDPSTNLGHNSIILMIEAKRRYIDGLVRVVLHTPKVVERPVCVI